MRDLNDSLDDLLAGAGTVQRTAAAAHVPADYQPRNFEETCPKCRGTGRFIGWSGRQLGECFACKGAGKKTFKSSSADRAKNREQAAVRAERKALSAWEDFVAAEPQIAAWIEAKAPTFAFAASMREAAVKWGRLTDGQTNAILKCMHRDEERKIAREQAVVQREQSAVAVDTSAIEQAFAKAIEKAARPGQQGVFVKPLKMVSGDVTLSVRPGTPGSKWEGMLFVKRADRKIGHIKGGKLFCAPDASDAEKAATLDCMANPAAGTVAYGKAYSSCGICGRGLLNDESISRGIGPICAEKFGF